MLTKTTLDSWFEPKQVTVKCECLTEAEEQVAEEVVCDMCMGTGEVDELMLDNDSHQWIVEGTKPCICQINEDNY